MRRFASCALVAAAMFPVGCATGEQPPTAPPASTVVTVGLTEFSLDLSRDVVPPGPVTFVAQQHGQASHALVVEGPGLPGVQTPVIQRGGEDQQLTATLQPGTYRLWCPVGRHREQGMTATLTVR
ncbi:hypothetical protein GCM10011581_27940 [Saccharopolyspora subtropica]|uniref:Uncharacterized protein n=1 Tax=Saccharopolyspora thermophila TaxID=89367 RepID=A0A917JXM0_9PSEU|nr:hypothetical protein [Saccharopolyspora subtropica]GGI89259.1 hypothetical protein GCM10011581_27940 [Saccharopolyspora subtropica]